MSLPNDLQVESAGPAHAAALAQLFASNGYGCYCRYWHFSGDARAWLARCAQRAEENAREMQETLCAGSITMRGVVATLPRGSAEVAGERDVVGWLKLAPAPAIPKLYEQRLYRGLPCFGGDRSTTFAVACLLVREDQRRRGIARAMLAAALELAPAWGATALEAFPRSDENVSGGALMMGPSKLFLDAGFETVHDFGPYPVLRRELGSVADIP